MMDETAAKKLRDPFPKSVIGKLPKGGVMLDYVGHAAVTDRLLQVDPSWTWEPMALTPEGLPALDRAGNLWIKLTICGVTRNGVGDGKNAKECISDAIRNAAMRFGVALDLWAKEDLHAPEISAEEKTPPAKPAVPSAGNPAARAGAAPDGNQAAPAPPSAADLETLAALVTEKGGDAAVFRAAAETAQTDGKTDYALWFRFQADHWKAHKKPFTPPKPREEVAA